MKKGPMIRSHMTRKPMTEIRMIAIRVIEIVIIVLKRMDAELMDRKNIAVVNAVLMIRKAIPVDIRSAIIRIPK